MELLPLDEAERERLLLDKTYKTLLLDAQFKII